MREILFRGKRTDTGEWVEGYYVARYEVFGELAHYIISVNHYDKSNRIFIVDPETVGQFTGLTDKNGTRIFEGDIVKYGDTYAVIEYDVECYDGYVVYGFAMCTKYGFVTSYDFEGANVIGNIHDNPELLEE